MFCWHQIEKNISALYAIIFLSIGLPSILGKPDNYYPFFVTYHIERNKRILFLELLISKSYSLQDGSIPKRVGNVKDYRFLNGF